MNVLYTCDNNYVWIMGISAISLYENNKDIKDLNVYLLGESISNENKKLLNEIGLKYKRNLIVIDVPEFDIPKSVISARWPLSAFTRLFSGELLPQEIEKILYLDCDTIIRGNISPLDGWNMKDKIFYGIIDCIGSAYKKNIGLHGNTPYINAGVLLIDLKKLRSIDMRKSINDYMAKYEKLISYADQDILNGVFYDRIGYLHPKYDVMTIDVAHSYEEIKMLRKPTGFYSKEVLKEAVNNPCIIHYTTNMLVIRPWYINSDHPLKEEFRKYMKISPWCNHPMKEMNFSGNAKIISLIMVMPQILSYRFLGIIHAVLKPIYTKFAAKYIK